MLGAIIGDTVGSVYEFNNIKTTEFELFGRGCNYTDDSVMTVAIAKWLIEDSQYSMEKLEDCMVEIAKQYPCPKGGYGGGFRTWLFQPQNLRNYENYQLSKTGRHPYGSYGNGSAMRVSAVGWKFNTLEETLKVAKISSEITHNHPEGIKGAQATASAIFLARNGNSKQEIKEYISSTFGYDLNRTCDQIRPTYQFNETCQETVPEAIIAFIESTDFENAIRLAVSLGGDCDTLTCITGAIAEAYYHGVPKNIETKMISMLPKEFVEILGNFNC
ncbi:MAG: ADP-ribosylglycohydrolase family protein [Bacteroidales bacterium]|nr:ADP-ribosylglycohydrolase family protein [Bacteroidales bacterium]